MKHKTKMRNICDGCYEIDEKKQIRRKSDERKETDQLYTGHMPDTYSTTQMFTCYDKYPEHLIDLSKYDFASKYNASLFEREGWENIMVDDSGAVCRDIARSMERYGVQVTCALSGEMAIQIVTDEQEMPVDSVDLLRYH